MTDKREGTIFERVCVVCQQTFTTDIARTRYCSLTCKKRAQNHRHYMKNRARIIKRVLKVRKQNKQ